MKPSLSRDPQKRALPYPLILCLFGGLGLLFFLFGGGEKETGVGEENRGEEIILRYEQALEDEIAQLCARVFGVSEVSVAVRLSSGYRDVYATEEERNESGILLREHYLTLGNGSSEHALYLATALPEIGGIGVVCRGGSDPGVQRELIALLSAAYGIPSSRIYVTGAK